MKAFNRVADVPIRIKSNIETPDVVVVIDDTLLKNPEVTSGLADDKFLLVNTTRSIEEVRNLTGYKGRIVVIPATDIALEEIKRGIPNTVMIGALIRATDIVPLDAVKEKIKAAFSKKFSDEVVRANIRALERGYQEVKLSD
jgi:2-oxoacid:acceptor oxidoreductase gamma subunit (pyruvate/2-ketoisovalerate family)